MTEKNSCADTPGCFFSMKSCKILHHQRLRGVIYRVPEYVHVGDVAQVVERSLSMREVSRSMLDFSIFFILSKHKNTMYKNFLKINSFSVNVNHFPNFFLYCILYTVSVSYIFELL